MLFWLIFLPLLLPAASPVSPAEPVYVRDIIPIMETRCQLKTCHDGSMPPSLDTYRQVRSIGKRLGKRLDDPLMPMPPALTPSPLTQAEKYLLQRWISSGMPEK